MANKISELTAASTPLAGTELAWVEQGGNPRKVAVSEIGGGGGASQLSDLSDVGTVGYTTGHVLVADGVNFDSAQLLFSQLGSTPTTLSGYGISDTKANFDAALSDGDFVYNGDNITELTGTQANFNTALSNGSFAFAGGAFHDGFSDYVANEHLDWTTDLGGTQINVNNMHPDTNGVTPADNFMEYNRFGAVYDMDLMRTVGQFGGFGAMTNGPTGMTYDPIFVGNSATDVTSQLVVPRTASRGLAYRGFSTSAWAAWHYAAWTTTAADADLSLYPKTSSLNIANWDAAYNDKINSASFNTGNGVLTLTQQDAGTVTVDLDGRYLQSYTTEVSEDTTPVLGGNLDMSTFRITGALGGDTGATTASITLTGAGTAITAGSYVSMGRLFSSAATFIGNNVYADSGDAVSGQLRHSVTHATYGHTIYEMNAGQHRWYGDSANVTAGTVVTKNLLMTLNETGNLVGTGTLTGFTSYAGITAANLVDKSATETITGTWTLDGVVTTSDYGTGGRVKDGTDVSRPIGFNVMPIYEIDANDTFDLAHNGMIWHKDAGAAVTFTCANDATIPQGATYVVHNDDTENLTIAQGTGVTIYWLGGGAAPAAGNVTVEQGGIVTVYKYTDTEFWVWGSKEAAGAGDMLLAGNQVVTGEKTWNDNVSLHFGTGDDVDFYFNGIDMYIDLNAAVDFRLRGGAATTDPMITAIADGGVYLYQNAREAGRTATYNAAGVQSTWVIEDHAGVDRYAGFNDLRLVANNPASVSVNEIHMGGVIYADDNTTFTVTLPSSTNSFPIGGVITIINANTSGSITVQDQASYTCFYLNGTTRVDIVGSCTVGPGGVATIWRQTTGGTAAERTFLIWGNGITA